MVISNIRIAVLVPFQLNMRTATGSFQFVTFNELMMCKTKVEPYQYKLVFLFANFLGTGTG